ncbi:PQQ-dependent sugar dehydrogenase [Flavobacteriaceae bacterium F08102]|nr:PQQ-dependent sugar dehydrogenase [Flavobacteriaceae bacterium F08102]
MKSICVLISLLVFSLSACAQQEESSVKAESPSTINYTVETVVSDMKNPWGMAFLPDGSLLVTEKEGKLLHVINGQKIEVGGLPEIYVRGQGGLMDVELHPNFSKNKLIYFSYASAEGEGEGGNTAIMRAKLVDNQLKEQKVLYKATPNTKRGQHFGSRISFDRDGFLYFSIGERGNRDVNPQDITRDGGKIYRLHDDGSIPKDNPFVNVPNAKKAIYSYGHRNPQGMIVHPVTGAIWTHEHGPRGGDEINIIQKGKNYGWPKISYGINYSGTPFTEHTALPGMEQPFFYWVPSIAPSGMAMVSSDKYPSWKGNLLVGSLKFQYLERLVIENNSVVKREKLLEGMGRVRSVVEAPDGYIYVGIENLGVVKIVMK